MYDDFGFEDPEWQEGDQLRAPDLFPSTHLSSKRNRVQFRLRTLFWFTACAAIACVITPPIWEQVREVVWPRRVQSIKEFLATRPRSAKKPRLDAQESPVHEHSDKQEADVSVYQRPLSIDD